MRATLEAHLWYRIACGDSARDAIAAMLERGDITSPKQAWWTLEKWSRAGLYDCGVALDLGWLNEGAVFPRAAERVA